MIPVEKRKISVVIDQDLYEKLWDHILAKAEKGRFHGMLSRVIEKALIRYLEEESGTRTNEPTGAEEKLQHEKQKRKEGEKKEKEK